MSVHRFPPLAALLLLLSAGQGAEAPGRSLHHLLEGGTAVTLGHETRIATGPPTVVLDNRWYASAAALPRALTLPAALHDARWILLRHRVWAQPERTSRAETVAASASEVRPVERDGERVVVVPERLRALVGGGARVEVSALPVDAGPQETRVPLAVSRGVELTVGYGLRPEHAAQGGMVRFGVVLTDDRGADHELFTTTLDPANPDHRRWFDVALDLGAFAGRRVEIALRTRPEPPATFALGVWSDPTVGVPEPDTDTAALNVVVVSLDTLRAKSLGCYGHGRDTSPFLDQVARQGTLFENAIAPATVTGPSHMSIFTGLYPPRHGMITGLEAKRNDVKTLAERFRAAGYHTAAFTENGYLIRDFGFADGFAAYTENTGQGGLSKPAQGEVRLTFGQAETWLGANRRFPFFLFVHTYEVHAPYRPPAEYQGLFADDGLPGQPERPMLRLWFTDYDREIRFVDDQIRRLFDALARRSLGETTIVVILSDHGEEFGEHGGWQHGATVYDELLRVPLIFWAPGRVPAGARHTTQVSLVDVAPTLLDMAGVPAPDTLQGRSLRAAIADGREPALRPVFAETRARTRWLTTSVERQDPPFVAVRRGTGKVIVNRPPKGGGRPPVAFDLARDPGEAEPQEVTAEEQHAVDRLVDEYLGAAGSALGSEGAAEQIAPDVRERLRQLGYLE
jgi:arylsulfatase A-like enzyme